MFYTLNLCNVICQLYFNKTRKNILETEFNGTPDEFFIILLEELSKVMSSLPPMGFEAHTCCSPSPYQSEKEIN